MNNKKEHKKKTQKENLDPNDPQDRQKIIKMSVQKTIKEYSDVLKMLGSE